MYIWWKIYQIYFFMACTDYLVVDVPDCLTPITVKALLTAQTEYLYRIIGDSKTAYWNTVITDINGSFEIDTSLFPEVYFNRFSGLYELTVYDSTNRQRVPIAGHDMLALRFQKTNLIEATIL